MPITHVVPIANMAGSAGKTTTTVSLAALLAQQGRRVLVADFDPQANATEWLGVDPDEVEVSSAKVLLKEATLAEAVQPTNVEGVWVLPASRLSMDADVMRLQGIRMGELRFRSALRDCPPEIDTVLIDCPGAMGLMTLAALAVATSVVTVTAPTSKELRGIPMLEQVLEDVGEELNPGVSLGGVVPCIVPPASAGLLYQDAIRLLDEEYGALVTPQVRKTVRAPEAQAHQVPLPVLYPSEPISRDYEAVLAALIERGVL